MENVNFGQFDTDDEKLKVVNRIVDNLSQIEGKVLQMAQEKEKTDAYNKNVDKFNKSIGMKGFVSMKLLVFIVVFVSLFVGVVQGQFQTTDINYANVSNPTTLERLLRDLFANQTSNSFRFVPTDTAPTCNEGTVYYRDSSDQLQLCTGSGSFIPIDTAGGNTLDGAYNSGGAGVGRTITADTGAFALTNTDDDTAFLMTINAAPGSGSALGGIEITMGGNSTENAIEFENSGSGDDVQGTGDTWAVTAAGVSTFLGAEIGVSSLTFTQQGEIIKNDTDNEVEFVGSEDFSIGLGSGASNEIDFTSDSSATVIDFTTLDTLVGLNQLTFDETDGAALITIAADGSGDDLTISQTGSNDASVVLASAGTAGDAIKMTTTAGGIDIDITGAADGEDFAVNTDSSIQLTASQAVSDAIKLNASAGAFDIDGTAIACAITQTSTGIDDNLTVEVLGATASSLILSSAGTGADAVDINATAGGVDIDSVTGITMDISGASAGEDFAITTDSSIVLTSSEDAADAIDINATAGGIDIDATGEAGQDIVLTNTGGSVQIVATEAEDDSVNIDSVGFDLDASGSIVLTSTENAVDSIVLQSTVGGIDILCDASTNEDIDIANTGGAVNLTSSEASDGAIKLQTSNIAGQILLVTADTSSDAVEMDISGGLEIDCVDVIAIDNSGSTKDITITSALGRVIITGTETAAAAVELVADGVAGGIKMSANTNGIDMDATGGSILLDTSGASKDIKLDADSGAVIIDGGETGATAVVIRATHSDGGIDIDFGTSGFSLVGASGDIVATVAGSVGDVITVTNTTGTGTAAIALVATAGGVEIDAAAGKIIALDGGTVTLASKTAGAGAISLTTNIGAAETILITNTAGTNVAAINVTATAGGMTIDTADDLALTVNSSGAGEDLILTVDGDNDAHILLTSDGTSINTISLLESGTGTGGGILIHAATGIGAADGVASVQLTSTAGGIGLKAAVDDTDAIDIDATVGSIDIDAAKNITMNSAADTITIQVDTDGTGNDDLTLKVDGDDDAHIILDSDGTSIDTIYLHQSSGTGGGIKIHADAGLAVTDGASSVQLLSDVGGIGIKATGNASTDAIIINAPAGGINIDAADDISIVLASTGTTEDLIISLTGAQTSSVLISSEGSDVDALSLTTVTNAGDIVISSDDIINIDAKNDIDILLTASQANEDILIATGGDQDSHVTITADGTSENAFTVLADEGNIDLTGSGASGEDFDITSTNSALNLTSGEAENDAIFINASTTGGGILFNSNNFDQKVITMRLSAGVVFATEIMIDAPGAPYVCVGLEAGIEEQGSTEGKITAAEDADIILFSIQLPEVMYDTGTVADLILEFDINEIDAGGTVDVDVFQYGDTTAEISDTITIANGGGRAWRGLTTLSSGIGGVATVDQGDVFLIRLSPGDGTSDFDIWGVRLTYRVGIDNTD